MYTITSARLHALSTDLEKALDVLTLFRPVLLITSDDRLGEELSGFLIGLRLRVIRARDLSEASECILDCGCPPVIVAELGVSGAPESFVLTRILQGHCPNTKIVLVTEREELSFLVETKRIFRLCPPFDRERFLQILAQPVWR